MVCQLSRNSRTDKSNTPVLPAARSAISARLLGRITIGPFFASVEYLLNAKLCLRRQFTERIVARDHCQCIRGRRDAEKPAKPENISLVAAFFESAEPHGKAFHGKQISRCRHKDAQARASLRRVDAKQRFGVLI